MAKLYVDAGTSWSKVLEIYEKENELLDSHLSPIENINSFIYNDFQTDASFVENLPSLNYRAFILPSKLLAAAEINFDGATGHMAKSRIKPDGFYRNEMLSLAYGAKIILSCEDLKNATIVDIGSRDVKWVRFIEGKYRDLDWNGNCGSVTGATVEMLSKFYGVDTSEISPHKEKIPVTCGVFAMEKIMDDIASNVSPEIAIAKYIHGIAYNTWNFSGCPEKIYLSGGFCLNRCFIESLKFYCDVAPLGRFVLLEGLY